MRLLAVGVLALGVNGCGETPYQQAIDMARSSVTRSPDSSIDFQALAGIPYASMGAKHGSAPQTLVVLAYKLGDRHTWVAPDQAGVVTRGPRLVKTLKLPGANIDIRDIRGTDPLMQPGPVPAGSTVTMVADYPDQDLYGLTIVCRMTPRDRQAILTLRDGATHRVVRIDEHCRADRLDWTFTNQYWRGTDDHRVWQSRQHYDPDQPSLEFQLFRRPA